MVVWNFTLWNRDTWRNALLLNCRWKFIARAPNRISHGTPDSLSQSSLRSDAYVLASEPRETTLFWSAIRKIATFPHDRKLLGWTYYYYRFAANVWEMLDWDVSNWVEISWWNEWRNFSFSRNYVKPLEWLNFKFQRSWLVWWWNEDF